MDDANFTEKNLEDKFGDFIIQRNPYGVITNWEDVLDNKLKIRERIEKIQLISQSTSSAQNTSQQKTEDKVEDNIDFWTVFKKNAINPNDTIGLINNYKIKEISKLLQSESTYAAFNIYIAKGDNIFSNFFKKIVETLNKKFGICKETAIYIKYKDSK